MEVPNCEQHTSY